MKSDFSRDTFDELNHFSRVLMQQGRVQLDADWNEQVAILLHYLQTLAADLIGPHGGPGDVRSTTEDVSFKVKPEGERKYDFLIMGGNYYVDGILCENNEKAVAYTEQPDYPLPADANLDKGQYLVYLDVWERHLSYIEDDSIREVALGVDGPDTATRAKVVWQVRAESEKGICPDDDKWADLVKTWQAENRGRLKVEAQITNETDIDKSCIVPPEARYRGAENQLYRVEIHLGGSAGEATFKWSRDNGSVVFPIRAVNNKVVTLEHLGLDNRYGLQEGDWVEIADDDYVLQGRAEPLLKVNSIDRVTMEVTLDKVPASNVGEDESKHPLLRRWDHKKAPEDTAGVTLDESGITIVEGTGSSGWLHLEDGIYVQFQSGATYRTGDYWLIPARTATGDVEWEWPKDDGAPGPHGVKHHYAPLAVISVADDGKVTVANHCRRSFASLSTLGAAYFKPTTTG